MPVERTRANNTWTESRYYSFIRSTLRRAFLRWPPRYVALERARRPSQDTTNKRLKWQFQCAHCNKWFANKDVQVDHVHACGSLKDMNRFVETLYCEADNLQVLCKPCHNQKTRAERND